MGLAALFICITVVAAFVCILGGVALTHFGKLMIESDDIERKIMGYIMSAVGYVLFILLAIAVIFFTVMMINVVKYDFEHFSVWIPIHNKCI